MCCPDRLLIKSSFFLMTGKMLLRHFGTPSRPLELKTSSLLNKSSYLLKLLRCLCVALRQPLWLSVATTGLLYASLCLCFSGWENHSLSGCYPCPSTARNLLNRISSWEFITSKIRSLDLLVCFPNDPEAKRPRLTPNQRLRLFWLDLPLFLRSYTHN